MSINEVESLISETIDPLTFIARRDMSILNSLYELPESEVNVSTDSLRFVKDGETMEVSLRKFYLEMLDKDTVVLARNIDTVLNSIGALKLNDDTPTDEFLPISPEVEAKAAEAESKINRRYNSYIPLLTGNSEFRDANHFAEVIEFYKNDCKLKTDSQEIHLARAAWFNQNNKNAANSDDILEQ